MSDTHTPPPSVELAPIRATERIATLDVLRGIALLGVLIANVWMWFSGTTFRFPAYAQELQQMSPDSIIFLAVAFFVSGKAITTFSFLFGLGFGVQMLRASDRGHAVTGVYSRRLIILALIGAAHAILIWYGDILLSYAVLGFALLLFQDRSEKTILWTGIVLVTVFPLILPAWRWAMSGRAIQPEATVVPVAEGPSFNERMLAAFGSADPVQIVQANLEMLPAMLIGENLLGRLALLGIFLLGLYAARKRYFEDPARHRRGLRLLMLIGFPFGAVLTVAHIGLRIAPPDAAWYSLALDATNTLGNVPFALAYIAAATSLMMRDRFRPALMAFAPVGRMALTNYLAQSVICVIIFYGGGLVGTVSAAAGLAISLLVFTMQMVFSRWWLAHYRFGPMEWLWRSATYGRAQPMRLEPAPRPALA